MHHINTELDLMGKNIKAERDIAIIICLFSYLHEGHFEWNLSQCISRNILLLKRFEFQNKLH